jgi:hypothetical protein
MSALTLDSFQSIDLDLLDNVAGGGDVNWGNAFAQGGIWGLAGGAGAAVTGVGAPAAWATAGIGAVAGFTSSVVSDLLH